MCTIYGGSIDGFFGGEPGGQRAVCMPLVWLLARSLVVEGQRLLRGRHYLGALEGWCYFFGVGWQDGAQLRHDSCREKAPGHEAGYGEC